MSPRLIVLPKNHPRSVLFWLLNCFDCLSFACWQSASGRPATAWRPGGPLLIFHSFFVQREIHAHAQICIRFGRAKWTMVSLNSFTILIIISILFDPFFPCMLLSEKRCHSLFILCLFSVYSLFIRLFIRPFACPNLMQICACAWIYHHGPTFSKTQKVATGC